MLGWTIMALASLTAGLSAYFYLRPPQGDAAPLTDETLRHILEIEAKHGHKD